MNSAPDAADVLDTPRAAFQYPDFRLYLAANVVSNLATQVQSIAVGWQVLELTGRPISLGYVGLAQFVPMLLLSPFAGDAADRFDRRRLVVLCEAVVAVTALLLYLIARAPHPNTLHIYAVLALFGAARAFAGPADSALLTHVVPRRHFPSAVAWTSTAWQVATIGGPALGGLLYGLAHRASTVYAVAAGLATCGFALLAAMRVNPGRFETTGSTWERVLAGVRYVRTQPVVLGAISLDLFAVLLGGAVALLPIFARDVLHVGPLGLGVLRSAPAAGATLTAVWLANHPIERRAGSRMLLAVAVFGVATIVFGLSRSFALSLLALFVTGASDMVSVVIRRTLIQVRTPSEMRGRVGAVNQVFVGASNELGEFESGVTAAWLTAIPAVVLGGVGTLVVVVLWGLLFPSLRAVDKLVEPDA